MIREHHPLRIAYKTDGDDITLKATTYAPAAGVTAIERVGVLQQRLLRRLLQDEALRDLARELLALYPTPEPVLSAEDALNRAVVEDGIVRAVLPKKTTQATIMWVDETPEKPWVPDDGRTWYELDDVRSWPHLHALLGLRVRYLRAENRERCERPSVFIQSLAFALERRDIVAVAFV